MICDFSIIKMSLIAKARGKLFRLGEQVRSTHDLLIQSKKWLGISTVPSSDVDVVVTFTCHTKREVINWITGIIQERVPELIIRQRFHRRSNEMALYITASYKDLLRGAEALCLRKRLLSAFGGGYREFSLDELDLFENVTEEHVFLTSQERQSIVLFWLLSLKSKRGERLYDLEFSEDQAIMPLLQAHGVVSQIFPLHNPAALSNLNSKWVHTVLGRQPLDDIQQYFGVRIALYFAWLGHYAMALVCPAILGVLWLGVSQSAFADVTFIVFIVLNLLWTTVYLEHWKRTSSALSYRWGTLDYNCSDLLEEPRPLFRGELRESPITGRYVPQYPIWRRRVTQYCISLPVTLACLCVVVLVTLCVTRVNLVLSTSMSTFIVWMPKVALAFIITLMDDAYKRVALYLNHLENHRLEETYRHHLILKLILFQCMNSYFPVLYIAFYLQDMTMLREQLTALLITRQLHGNFKEIMQPYLQTKLRQWFLGYRYEQRRHRREARDENVTPAGDATTTDTNATSGADDSSANIRQRFSSDFERRSSTLSTESSYGEAAIIQAEEEAFLPAYVDPYDDFLEMFIQFGYLTMFFSVFPLAGVCCLVNNVMEIRSDAFKLTTTYQRPFGKNDANIGIWQTALEVLSYVSVLVNVALLGVSGTLHSLCPTLDKGTAFVLLVVLEHAILIAKFLVAYAIPDVPYWVEEEIAKMEYKRREALKVLEKESLRERRRGMSESRVLESEGAASNVSSSTAPRSRETTPNRSTEVRI